MYRLRCLQQPLGTFFARPAVGLPSECQMPGSHHSSIAKFVRYASQSKRPPSQLKSSLPGKSAKPKVPEPYVRKRQVDPSKKASSLLNHLSKATRTSPSDIQPAAPKLVAQPAKVLKPEVVKDDAGSRVVEIDEKEEEIQKRILRNRRKLLWPGIWTVFALAGTWGALAYLDTRFNGTDPATDGQLNERISVPQTWVLWPSVAWEGIKAGWKEADNVTIGIVVTTIGVQLLRRSPLPIWEKMIHITGEKLYTTFTYPFVHHNWSHLITNMYLVTWFMPGVVHYFDGDLFHATALFFSVPLLTSYGAHFAFRTVNVRGIPLNMGSSGAAAAILGAFCVAYPDEKVWVPTFAIFRLDAKYCSAIFVAWQMFGMLKPQKGGLRSVNFLHTVSMAIGAAYIYFDGKDKLWKPLVTRFANASESPAQP
ncbi:hypothetical protein DE146DRAFT_634324 [Phaeosphaeria sp. MPI-PUGE-AT-0046c]|nr:hypothetical protein DE146DRAFT_634324 [Phaeosphaeria sp. MPI-PUGE-AT-0046c]